MSDYETSKFNWKNIRSYSTVIEAELARTKLESEDIECVLRDTHLLNTNMLLSSAIGGVKLDVKSEDVLRAQEVLNDVIIEQKKCEKCGSTDVVQKKPAWKLSFLVFLATQFPIPFRRTKYQCQNCHHEFSL